MIVVELGEAVADVTVTNYETMELAATLFQETGTVEIPMGPGEYAIMVDAYEGTSLCRGGRRQVVDCSWGTARVAGLGTDAIGLQRRDGFAWHLNCTAAATMAPRIDARQHIEVWSEILPAGEHVLEGIAPGDYVLKVTTCALETYELVSLLDAMWHKLSSWIQWFCPSGC